jgi:DNA-binding transcriptional regulator LsrR (DeoR family)
MERHPDPLNRLSQPTRIALAYAVAGMTNAEIAQRMGLTASSVAEMFAEAGAEFGVNSRTDLIAAITRPPSYPDADSR